MQRAAEGLFQAEIKIKKIFFQGDFLLAFASFVIAMMRLLRGF